MYPLDFHIVDMPRDSFCPILLGRPFVSITKARIDNKKETISMMFGEKEIMFHFAKLKKRPYEEEAIKERKTIVDLATIHFSTPQDELERSLINWEEVPDDEEREDMDGYFDSILEAHNPHDYEELVRKGDEE